MNATIKLSSETLQKIQNLLDAEIESEMSNSCIEYERVSELALIAQQVDAFRRQEWNDEKFGVYEKIADEFFSADSVPF